MSNKSRVYFQEENAKILYADTLTTRFIENESIDLIVTSPPYNLNIEYKLCNDAQPYEDYLKFTEAWLKRCLKWLRSDGRMCLNIPLDKNKGGHQSVGPDIIEIAKKLVANIILQLFGMKETFPKVLPGGLG